jgi:3-hydroxyacyl-[acyl-carrier-protein] dehydratase
MLNKKEIKVLNREQIEQFMPHRHPMLLLDEMWLVDQKTACAHYTVPEDAWYLQGHFPGLPVVPGVILCEIMAQTAGILVKDLLQAGWMPLFAGMDKVRFRRVVKPGDRLLITCRQTRQVSRMIKIEGEVLVDSETAAYGQFLLMLVRKEEQDVS